METVAPIATALVVLALLFKPFFGGWEGFVECLRFYFTPDVLSLLRGEFVEDAWSETKLLVWLLVGVGSGLSLYFWWQRRKRDPLIVRNGAHPDP